MKMSVCYHEVAAPGGRAAPQGVGMGLAGRVVEILEPYVGRAAADTCVRGTALSCGKVFDTLGPEDVPALTLHVRRMLDPVVPASTLDAIVERIDEATP